jgi:hypothetical protein
MYYWNFCYFEGGSFLDGNDGFGKMELSSRRFGFDHRKRRDGVINDGDV